MDAIDWIVNLNVNLNKFPAFYQSPSIFGTHYFFSGTTPDPLKFKVSYPLDWEMQLMTLAESLPSQA